MWTATPRCYRACMRRLAIFILICASAVVPIAAASAPALSLARGRAPIVLIVLENKMYKELVGSPSAPYLNLTFIPQGTLFSNYSAITHPSLPNYLAMTAGDTLGCTTDNCAQNIPGANLFHQLDAGLIQWRAYEESMPSPCFGSNAGDYAVRHNPAVYYADLTSGSCAARDVPYPATLRQPLAPFTFVTPNLCNDMHSCPIATGDSWLAVHVPDFLAAGAIVIITVDEGSARRNQVMTAMVGPGIPAGVIDATSYTHYGLLAGIENYFGLANLRQARTSTPVPI